MYVITFMDSSTGTKVTYGKLLDQNCHHAEFLNVTFFLGLKYLTIFKREKTISEKCVKIVKFAVDIIFIKFM